MWAVTFFVIYNGYFKTICYLCTLKIEQIDFQNEKKLFPDSTRDIALYDELRTEFVGDAP